MKKSGCDYVFLDATGIAEHKLKKEFPNIYNKCLQEGINIKNEFIPVVPAAHYICGGIMTDLKGKTGITNLYCVGEAGMTGVHGANRLASNSLLEALVFSNEAGIECRQYFKSKKSLSGIKLKDIPEWDESGTVNTEEWILISQDKTEIKQLMSNYVGIVRSNLRLNRALRRINLIQREIENFYKKTRVTRELLELRNIGLIAYLIIKSALMRKESRGLHYNTDYPETSDKFLKDTVISNKSI
jgi:L-aspartate oxidase